MVACDPPVSTMIRLAVLPAPIVTPFSKVTSSLAAAETTCEIAGTAIVDGDDAVECQPAAGDVHIRSAGVFDGPASVTLGEREGDGNGPRGVQTVDRVH